MPAQTDKAAAIQMTRFMTNLSVNRKATVPAGAVARKGDGGELRGCVYLTVHSDGATRGRISSPKRGRRQKPEVRPLAYSASSSECR